MPPPTGRRLRSVVRNHREIPLIAAEALANGACILHDFRSAGQRTRWLGPGTHNVAVVGARVHEFLDVVDDDGVLEGDLVAILYMSLSVTVLCPRGFVREWALPSA